jgi:hypothetical protein
MNKEFVPYEQALALKELGFDEPCFGYYVNNELRGINLGIEELGGKEPYYQRFGFHTISNHDIDNPNKIVVTAPLYQQAFRWFREKYNLNSFIQPLKNDDDIDIYIFAYGIEEIEHNDLDYLIHEEAELECLKKLIEIVKNRNNGK